MGFFNNILDKLGMGKAQAATPDQPGAAPTQDGPAATPTVDTTNASAAPAQSVDVTAQLEQRAAANSQKLNWRTSIVDLLKLLDLDSSLTARKQLATELDCPAALMADSAQMNTWLHKAVLQRLAANGGKVPHELLD